MQFMQGVFQAIENGIDLFTCDDKRRLNTNDARIVQCTRDEHTTLEEARGYRVPDIVIHKVLTDQQTFACDICIDIAMTRSNLLELLDKVLALLSSLLRDAFFQSDIDSGNGGGTGQRIATGCRGMNERIAIHHTPDLWRGHKRTDGHNTTTQRFGGRDDIGGDIPMFNAPELARTSHTSLYLISDEQNLVLVADLA